MKRSESIGELLEFTQNYETIANVDEVVEYHYTNGTIQQQGGTTATLLGSQLYFNGNPLLHFYPAIIMMMVEHVIV